MFFVIRGHVVQSQNRLVSFVFLARHLEPDLTRGETGLSAVSAQDRLDGRCATLVLLAFGRGYNRSGYRGSSEFTVSTTLGVRYGDAT